MNTKGITLILLFVISVTTLILAIFGGQSNRGIFTTATVISHMALVGFGYYYAKSKHEAFLKSLRKDLGF